jgi:DNA-3-methyladenine glycosylase
MELPRSSDGDVKQITREFFRRDPVSCAREMIGCTISVGGCSGKIVETEAYAAKDDPACHTWKRQKARDFVAGNLPGTAYVYLSYGMHWLLNFLAKGGKQKGFVLLRALEPLQGIELMRERRGGRGDVDLCNGPAKLTQALGISGYHHGCDPLGEEEWKLLIPATAPKVITSTRVGISMATDRRWRFILEGNPHVSVPG